MQTDTASVSTAATKSFKSRTTFVDIDDDDALSSVSFTSHSQKPLRMMQPSPRSSPTAASRNASHSVLQQQVEAIFTDILDWLEDASGVRISPMANANSTTAGVLTSTVPPPRPSTGSQRLFAHIDAGESLIKLLQKSKIESKNIKAAEPPSNASPNERKTFNMNLFRSTCKEIGIPEQYTLTQGDRNTKRIIGCFVLLSRACRANNNRAVRALPVQPRSLVSLGMRLDELSMDKPDPSLQEMQLKGSFWVPDSFSDTCLLCNASFTLLQRRSHCRSCGTLCCHKCNKIKAKCLGYSKPQRICTTCVRQREAFVL